MSSFERWFDFVKSESLFDRKLNTAATMVDARVTSAFSLEVEVSLHERQVTSWHERTSEKEIIKDPSLFELQDRDSSNSGKISSAYQTERGTIVMQVTCNKPELAQALSGATRVELVYADFLKALRVRLTDMSEDEQLSARLNARDFRAEALSRLSESGALASGLTQGSDPGRSELYKTLEHPFFDAQAAAIAAARSLPLSFIWGPPGTGKTHTLGHIVAQLITAEPSQKILAISLANRGIEQMVIRADDAYRELTGETVEKGVLLRTQVPSLEVFKERPHLTAWVEAQSEHWATLAELSRERDTLNTKLRDGLEGEEREQAIQRLEALIHRRLEEVEKYKQKRVELIAGARAVFCTINQHSWAPDLCADYDVVIIEEASMVPMFYVQDLFETYPNARFVIAGDHQQLQPIIDVKQHKKVGSDLLWGESPFGFFDVRDMSRSPVYERQGSNHAGRALSEVNLLNIQSRMPGCLGELISKHFYDGHLRSLRPRGDFARPNERWPDRSLLIIDQREASYWAEDMGFEFKTDKLGDNTSRGEAQAAVLLAKQAHEGGRSVTIITPFRNQRALIKSYLTQLDLPDSVDCSTVHSAQGSQADVIIYSLVKPRHSFLAGPEAVHLHTVALSRAEQQLVLLVDLFQAKKNPHLKHLITEVEEWLLD